MRKEQDEDDKNMKFSMKLFKNISTVRLRKIQMYVESFIDNNFKLKYGNCQINQIILTIYLMMYDY